MEESLEYPGLLLISVNPVQCLCANVACSDLATFSRRGRACRSNKKSQFVYDQKRTGSFPKAAWLSTKRLFCQKVFDVGSQTRFVARCGVAMQHAFLH